MPPRHQGVWPLNICSGGFKSREKCSRWQRTLVSGHARGIFWARQAGLGGNEFWILGPEFHFPGQGNFLLVRLVQVLLGMRSGSGNCPLEASQGPFR